MNSSPKYKKIVVCLSRFPYPLEKGDKLRAYYQLKDLSQHFEIYLFCTSDKKISPENYEKIAPLCKEIYVYPLKKVLILWNLFFNFFTHKPFQVAYFTQNRIKRKISDEINKIQPDHIYCQLIRTAEYVKNQYACPKTIDLMDALSKGMERRLKDSFFLFRWIFREEAIRLKKYESLILNYFDQATIISEQDKSYIFCPQKFDIHVLPNGISERFFNHPAIVRKEFDLIFTGNMSYEPNVKSAQYISKYILPRLVITKPEIRIAIVGASPARSVLKLQNKNIIVTGWVDQIENYYLQSSIFIAPMFSGSGMQNKILEAMASGIPCVTTSLANNAILANHGKEIMIADTEDEIIKAINSLMEDKNLYHSIAQKGQEFVSEKYKWAEINQKLVNLLV